MKVKRPSESCGELTKLRQVMDNYLIYAVLLLTIPKQSMENEILKLYFPSVRTIESCYTIIEGISYELFTYRLLCALHHDVACVLRDSLFLYLFNYRCKKVI